MARFVKVASPLFTARHAMSGPDPLHAALDELAMHQRALVGENVDLVVFSEGMQSMQSVEQAERVDKPGPLLAAYQTCAKTLQCTIAASLKRRDNEHIYNSIVFLNADGFVLGTYDKHFLIQPELDAGLTPGAPPTVIDTPVGRLAGAICFDLNFPELCEMYADQAVDMLVFPSMYHGGLMQAWWAYRCRSFFISALPFHGGGILNPHGIPVALTDCYHTQAIATVNLDRVMVHLDYNREKFPAIRETYPDDVVIEVPPNIGSAIIYSASDNFSAREIAEKFELTRLDDYFQRAREMNEQARQ